MKVRHGFVSNSSSSSFCIYGAEIDTHDLEEKIKEIRPDLADLDCIYELTEELDTTLSIHLPSNFDTAYIGRSWSSVRDNETGKQFKESVEKEVSDLLKEDISCSTHSESWYD